MLRFYRSTIGKKYIMAVTGFVLIMFVLGHMVGNLKIFAGVDSKSGLYKLDVYAVFLREAGAPLFGQGQLLWIARVALLGCVLLHILAAIQLTLLSRAARPVSYARNSYGVTTYAARTMRWGGVIVALYIVYHLLHFTFGKVHAGAHEFEHGWVYWNVYHAFRHWYIAAIYTVANAAVCVHLYHGTWSMFQTLGIDAGSYRRTLQLGAKLFAWAMFIGYVSVPVCVLSGCIPQPNPYAGIMLLEN